MNIYRVRRYFVNSVIGPKFAGETFPEFLLKYLTENEKKNLDKIDITKDFDLFNYGLIFYSTEIDFPEPVKEETYSEMVCRLIEESKYCCKPDCECKNNK